MSASDPKHSWWMTITEEPTKTKVKHARGAEMKLKATGGHAGGHAGGHGKPRKAIWRPPGGHLEATGGPLQATGGHLEGPSENNIQNIENIQNMNYRFLIYNKIEN